MGGGIQLDETFVGGKNQNKSIVLVAAEEGARVRLVQAPGNYEACIKHVVGTEIAAEATVKTDGHAAYNQRTLAKSAHDGKVQTKAEKKSNDHLQLCYWAASAAERWLLATHCGAASEKHLQSYSWRACISS
ncbi:MAG: transposase [Pseudomonadota bacterium]